MRTLILNARVPSDNIRYNTDLGNVLRENATADVNWTQYFIWIWNDNKQNSFFYAIAFKINKFKKEHCTEMKELGKIFSFFRLSLWSNF